jgi:DNA-binding response OmpR family regulator
MSFKEEKIDICTLGDPVDFVRKSPSDLIILDCGSHAEKGLHFLKEIKSQDFGDVCHKKLFSSIIYMQRSYINISRIV